LRYALRGVRPHVQICVCGDSDKGTERQQRRRNGVGENLPQFHSTYPGIRIHPTVAGAASSRQHDRRRGHGANGAQGWSGHNGRPGLVDMIGLHHPDSRPRTPEIDKRRQSGYPKTSRGPKADHGGRHVAGTSRLARIRLTTWTPQQDDLTCHDRSERLKNPAQVAQLPTFLPLR